MDSKNAISDKRFRKEYLILAVVLVLSIYFLTPRGWEQSESLTAWAAAKILAETGGFPVFSRNVLYSAYLTLFLKLPFPISIILEYWVTHLFALAAIYALVRANLSMTKSMILVVVLTPLLVVVEGAGTVAAIGFFSLYLRSYVTNKKNTWIFLPATLLAAALCHSSYWPFLALHLLVAIYFVLVAMSHEARAAVAVRYGRPTEIVLLLFLLGFTVTALLLQSGRIDNNHMLMDPRFSPIPLTSAINIGFFQISTWEIVEKLYAPAVLVEKDWFFETPLIFGGSQTILDVMISTPHLFFEIVTEEIGFAALLPLYFYSFLPLPVFRHAIVLTTSASLLMLLMGLYRVYRVHGVAALFVLVVGGSSLIAAFLLTSLNARYIITFLPIFLLVYTGFIGEPDLGERPRLYTKPIFKNGLFILGCLLVLANAPFQRLIPLATAECDGSGDPSTVRFKAGRFACYKMKGVEYQLRAVLANRDFLHSGEGMSLIVAHQALSRLIKKSDRILSSENLFFATFTEVGIDNSRQIMSLPPYPDRTEYSEHFLSQIDVFMVSDALATDRPSVSTQSFLRYKLHILPYLIANKEIFNTVHIPRYGNAYVRKRKEAGNGS